MERNIVREKLIAALRVTQFPQVEQLASACGIDFRQPDSEEAIADALLPESRAEPDSTKPGPGVMDVLALYRKFNELQAAPRPEPGEP